MAIKKTTNSNTPLTSTSNSQTTVPCNIPRNGDVASRKGERMRQCSTDEGEDDGLGMRTTTGEGNEVAATNEPEDAHK